MLTIPLYINPAGELLKRPGYTDKFLGGSSALTLKRGITYRFQVYFVGTNNATPARLAVGAEVQVTLKPKGKFDSTPALAQANTSVRPAADSDPYLLDLVVNSAGLDALMLVDVNLVNDLPSVQVEFEVAWTLDDWVAVEATIDQLQATINNNVKRDTDGTPLQLPTPEEWLASRLVQPLLRSRSEGLSNITVDKLASEIMVYDSGTWSANVGAGGLPAATLAPGIGTWVLSVYTDGADVGVMPPTYEAWLDSADDIFDSYGLWNVTTGSGQPAFTLKPCYKLITGIGQLLMIGVLPSDNPAPPYDLYVADSFYSFTPISIGGYPAAWNATQSIWQKLVISGSSGSEQLIITTIS